MSFQHNFSASKMTALHKIIYKSTPSPAKS